MTHTNALMDVSRAAHAEIDSLLRAAGYDHAIDNGVLDMSGIALVASSSPTVPWDTAERVADIPAVHEALQSFSDDPTGDNGTAIVRLVLEHAGAPDATKATGAPRFPIMLRKMWSGGEVQQWIDANWLAQGGNRKDGGN